METLDQKILTAVENKIDESVATKNTLAKIQSQIKVPKSQFNEFGKYKYRSCEDILEAVKLVINPIGFSILITDELVSIGSRYYVKSIATITDGIETFSSTAYAREEETKKGMDGAQITGASSSYARKYALNGLFAIDDTKDADDEVKPEEKKETKTTLYNHKEIGNKTLPLIKNGQFKKACERIEAGELDLYYKVIADFSMTSDQSGILKAFYNKAKAKKEKA